MVVLSFVDLQSVYKRVKGSAGSRSCSVMIMAAYDIDSLSATKILTQMLRTDNILHTLLPVGNISHVQAAFQQRTQNIDTIFLINCGAIYNIPSIFNLYDNPDLHIYVLDNHRPIHLKNVYSDAVTIFDDNQLDE